MDDDRLDRELSKDSFASSHQSISSVDKELERISHYEDQRHLVPEYLSWGAHCLRSPTLDEPDEFITDRPLGLISNVSIAGTKPGTTWDVELEGDRVKEVAVHDASRLPPAMTNSINGNTALLAPSLCHPHVHLDKAFLLAHPRYTEHAIKDGGFDEAMELTGKAKAQFTEIDLMERGQRLIDESITAGVTHMRAFVEVDIVVGMKCLNAGLGLRRRARDGQRCDLQICAFAQLPLFTTAQSDTNGDTIRSLLQRAASTDDVEVVGSTPYVEADRARMEQNIEYMVDLAIKTKKHLDFHLDYNLDLNTEPTVWHVIKTLKKLNWLQHSDKTIMLGHCTRLTLFSKNEWRQLRQEIGDLPISFCGLPTSDLLMMKTKDGNRGTLDLPSIIKDHEINACLGVNNIGNAFTPQGSCDPMTLACNGIGIYQAATEQDAELLYECVSTRARRAIGYEASSLSPTQGSPADFVLFPSDARSHWRTRHTIAEAVYLYDGGHDRQVFYEGRSVG